MKDHTIRLLEALKREHSDMLDSESIDFESHYAVFTKKENIGICETCQLIAEVEAELEGGEDE